MNATPSMKQPRIPRAHTALILNDMINSNLRSDPQRTQQIHESGLIATSVQCVTVMRTMQIPIFWIRVERRADRADHIDTITDEFLRAGGIPRSPVVGRTFEAMNVEELPVHEDDYVILKPRFDPFFGTGLDYQLRARGVTTLLLGGYSTNVGVESCARTARDIGYDVVVLSDCCYNVERDLHEWTLERILPKFARVMPWERARALID